MSEEYKAKTREMIKVMQAYVDGQGIEQGPRGIRWIVIEPVWDWATNTYRIAQTPDTIDWSHVAPEWKYMARDSGDIVYFFKNKPDITNGEYDESSIWAAGGGISSVTPFASYKRGTVDWKDSLVKRPG